MIVGCEYICLYTDASALSAVNQNNLQWKLKIVRYNKNNQKINVSKKKAAVLHKENEVNDIASHISWNKIRWIMYFAKICILLKVSSLSVMGHSWNCAPLGNNFEARYFKWYLTNTSQIQNPLLLWNWNSKDLQNNYICKLVAAAIVTWLWFPTHPCSFPQTKSVRKSAEKWKSLLPEWNNSPQDNSKNTKVKLISVAPWPLIIK